MTMLHTALVPIDILRLRLLPTAEAVVVLFYLLFGHKTVTAYFCQKEKSVFTTPSP